MKAGERFRLCNNVSEYNGYGKMWDPTDCLNVRLRIWFSRALRACFRILPFLVLAFCIKEVNESQTWQCTSGVEDRVYRTTVS